MSSLIEIEGLRKTYGAFTLAIDRFRLDEGEVVCLLGRNGAGKSTLLDLVLGERDADAGSVLLFGMHARTHGVETKRRIGFVIDDAGFCSKLSVHEAARVCSLAYPTWNAALVDELLERFKIDAHATFEQLSRGMKVKADLALALGHQPDLLILDEITSGLDIVSRGEVLDTVRTYVEKAPQRGALASTHLANDVKRLGARVELLLNGSLAAHACDFDPDDPLFECEVERILAFPEGDRP